MRGNLLESEDANNRIGSIPACAGEPDNQFTPSNRKPVYPRVCGGTPPLFLTTMM